MDHVSGTVALVGRPNVGKSTLFNKLTRSRDALVANVPGLTRDRRYGVSSHQGKLIRIIDTGGVFGDHELSEVLFEQTQVAIGEADLVVLMFDGREGITAIDQEVVDYLRTKDVSFIPVVNKVDGVSESQIIAEFSRFGFDELTYISSSHGIGVSNFLDVLGSSLESVERLDREVSIETDAIGTKVAVIGRPNVGKSTLVNRLVGEDRQVVFDMPGTTKDSIDIPFSIEGVNYTLIDTAGVRRKGKVSEVTEKFSVVKALDAMERAQIAILVLDAKEGVVDQDLHILEYALSVGSGLIIAVNKWDGLNKEEKERANKSLERKLAFIPWVVVKRISALHGTGVGHLFSEVDKVTQAGRFEVSTSFLSKTLELLVQAHPAPSIRGRNIRLKVATRSGEHPPKITVHGNQLKALPASYKRYLENGFREALDLIGNPVFIDFKDSENPYAGRRNELTRKQQSRRTRIIRHKKRRQRRQ